MSHLKLSLPLTKLNAKLNKEVLLPDRLEADTATGPVLSAQLLLAEQVTSEYLSDMASRRPDPLP